MIQSVSSNGPAGYGWASRSRDLLARGGCGNGTTGSTFNIPGTPNILKEYRFRDLDELENFALHGPHMRVYPTDMYEALNYGSVMPRDAYTTFGNMHFPVPD